MSHSHLDSKYPASIYARVSGAATIEHAQLLRLCLAARKSWLDSLTSRPVFNVIVGEESQDTHFKPSTRELFVSRKLLDEEFHEIYEACSASFGMVCAADAKDGAVVLSPHPGELKKDKMPKALFFKGLLNSADKELGVEHLYQGVFYIVSSLKKHKIPFVLVDGRMSLDEGEFITKKQELEKALAENPDINFVGITLFDSYFEQAAQLIDFIRERSHAYIAVGGYMPTQNPYEVAAHLSGVDFIIRGAGEEIVVDILKILGSSNRKSGLSEVQLAQLRMLRGLICLGPNFVLLAGDDEVLQIENLDHSPLDFSILERDQVSAGTVLYFSRGCPYTCLFCTSMDKMKFNGRSPADLSRLLSSYGRRLLEIYGRWSLVPPQAFGIGFYDDDFLSDPKRAKELFKVFLHSPFYIQFFQASINSFFVSHHRRKDNPLHVDLLDSMPKELFLPRVNSPGLGNSLTRPYIYIGTENYCDRELVRLGKPYNFSRIRTLIEELSRREIRQAHHFIVSNVQTQPEDILENLQRIKDLDAAFGPYFSVLKPVISHLVSFYSSPSYKILARRGWLSQIGKRKLLSIAGYSEFDYPLVDRDYPLNPISRAIAEQIGAWTHADSWEEVLWKTRWFIRTPIKEVELNH